MDEKIDIPQNARSRRTRTTILDAAWKLIEEEGAEQLTMAEVARRSAVTRRAIYLHFGSRGELLLAILEHVNEKLDIAASIRPVSEAPDALAALDAFAAHIARFHARILPLVHAIDHARRSDPDAEAVWQRAMQDWYAGCRKLASALAAEGRLAEPWTVATAADLLWALMSVELLEDLTVDRGWSQQDYADRLALLVRRTLTR